MGLENGKCGNSFRLPHPKPQTSKTDVCVRQVIRNYKNIISGPLYKYDKLRNSHDLYAALKFFR